MMQKLADVKQVGRHSGKQLSDLLIVKKGKRELLIMLKDLISHVMLDLRTHDMTVIRNKEIAVAFQRHHSKHHRAQLCNDLQCLISRQNNDICRNIPHDQRDTKRYASAEDRKQQIREKKHPVRSVIAGKPLPLMFHKFSPPFSSNVLPKSFSA